MVLVALAASACSTVTGAESLAASSCESIYLGQPDNLHRAVVALIADDGSLACSGALVGALAGKAAFLTAAHCLERTLRSVAVGADYARPAQSLAIASALEHPRFEHATGRYDFALVLTDEAPVNVRPLTVAAEPSRDIDVGDDVLFVGFGSTDMAELPSSRRQEVSARVDVLRETEFEYAQDEGGPCFGDSGGPALAPAADGEEQIVGITSYGEGGCRARGTSARAAVAKEFLASLDATQSPCPRPAPETAPAHVPDSRSLFDRGRSEIWKGNE